MGHIGKVAKQLLEQNEALAARIGRQREANRQLNHGILNQKVRQHSLAGQVRALSEMRRASETALRVQVNKTDALQQRIDFLEAENQKLRDGAPVINISQSGATATTNDAARIKPGQNVTVSANFLRPPADVAEDTRLTAKTIIPEEEQFWLRHPDGRLYRVQKPAPDPGSDWYRGAMRKRYNLLKFWPGTDLS